METEQKQPEQSLPAETGSVPPNDTPETSPASPVRDTSPFKNLKLVGLSLFGLIFMLSIVYAGYALYEGPIARVNGVDISREDYEKNVKILEESAVAQGADITDEDLQKNIRQQSLDILVNTALLKGAAEKAGIVVPPADVERIFSSFTEQLKTSPELQENMSKLGITEEKMRSNILDRLMIDAFIEAQTDIKNITVSDEEITALFDSISQNNLPASDPNTVPGGLPATESAPKIELTEDIKVRLDQEIRLQKQQVMINSLLEKVRAESEVKINL